MQKPRLAAASGFLAALLLVGSAVIALAAPDYEPTAPDACSELVKNGNFESGSANWTQEGGYGVQLITPFNPRTGQYSAQFGGANSVNQRVRQQITFPTKSVVTLRFWWEQWTQETAPGTQDYLAVNLLAANGSLIRELARLGADPDRPQWDELTFDLSVYAGQTVQLQFQAVTDLVNPTDFFVDDVSVTTCAAKRTYLPLTWR